MVPPLLETKWGASLLATQYSFGGVTLGFDRPLAFVVLPVGLAVLAWIVLRARSGTGADRRTRAAMFATRTIVLLCLVVAAAGPYTVSQRTVVSDPRVTVLQDDSTSMDVFDADVDSLIRAIEGAGVPVTRRTVGSDNVSRIGDGVVGSAQAGGNVLLVSDGRVTDGRSLASAAEFARSVNATISTLRLGDPAPERAVRVAGPPKVTTGVENTFRVSVDGVDTGSVPVTVTVDDQQVLSTTVSSGTPAEFSYTFDSVGIHRVVARIDGQDRIAANDVSYRTVQAIEPPSILYVSRGTYPFADLLSQLYDVTSAQSVPKNLDPYTAVVVQDVRADDVGNLEALRSFVADGNGLVVVGGKNAFENGGYAESPLSTLLPVQPGSTQGGGATVILTIDVSGSTADGMLVQKALALDVLDQLDDDDTVGIVAFDSRSYLVARPAPLGQTRALLEDRIRRLTSGGGTSIISGLAGASDVLGGSGGNVVLLTDGLDDSQSVVPTAKRLASEGVRIITVGVGKQVNDGLLRTIAGETGGSYLRASEASRLRILFGDRPRTPSGSLTVVDSGHFITAGIDPTANPSEHQDVSVRPGADYLVATGDGSPALAAWQFGLGRVVTVTAYGSDGTLDGLLGRPDSLFLSRSVNWAIGDPSRRSTGLVSLADTRLGAPTTAVYVGTQRPTTPDARFVRVGEDRYEATILPTSQGFDTVLDRPYAVDYPVELSAFGVSPDLESAVETTGGRTFGPGQAAAIAEFVRRRATVVQAVRNGVAWPFLIAAIVVFLGDVAARRLHVYGPGDRTGV